MHTMSVWCLHTAIMSASRIIHMMHTGPFHFEILRVGVINDRLNEVGRSGLTQSVLFRTAAKRKTPASSPGAIPDPNPIFITETGGLGYHWGDLKQR